MYNGRMIERIKKKTLIGKKIKYNSEVQTLEPTTSKEKLVYCCWLLGGGSIGTRGKKKGLPHLSLVLLGVVVVVVWEKVKAPTQKPRCWCHWRPHWKLVRELVYRKEKILCINLRFVTGKRNKDRLVRRAQFFIRIWERNTWVLFFS